MTPEFFSLIRSRHELLNDPRFQDWVKETEAQLQDMQSVGLHVTKASVEGSMAQAQMLSGLGLEPPQDAEDSIRIYLALRCVLNFWRRKLDQLKAQSDMYEQEQKRLNDRNANGDIVRRTVAR